MRLDETGLNVPHYCLGECTKNSHASIASASSSISHADFSLLCTGMGRKYAHVRRLLLTRGLPFLKELYEPRKLKFSI
jgi:hypothetical protein